MKIGGACSLSYHKERNVLGTDMVTIEPFTEHMGGVKS